MLRRSISTPSSLIYNDEIEQLQYTLTEEEEAIQAILHEVENHTFDADLRSIARNYIVQLSIGAEYVKDEILTFIDKAMTSLEEQPIIL